MSPWLVDARVARRLVPRELSIVELLPGLTLGAVVVASYADSPIGGYDELGYLPAAVHVRSAWGFFVSHLFVDSPASREAGRANWGLPKELAGIAWRQDGHRLQVEVRQRQRLCLFESRQRGVALPARVTVPLLSVRAGVPCVASLHIRAHLAPGSSRLSIAEGSPLQGLGLRLGLPSLWAWNAEIELSAPRSADGRVPGRCSSD
jgi:hypothetical protein